MDAKFEMPSLRLSLFEEAIEAAKKAGTLRPLQNMPPGLMLREGVAVSSDDRSLAQRAYREDGRIYLNIHTKLPHRNSFKGNADEWEQFKTDHKKGGDWFLVNPITLDQVVDALSSKDSSPETTRYKEAIIRSAKDGAFHELNHAPPALLEMEPTKIHSTDANLQNFVYEKSDGQLYLHINRPRPHFRGGPVERLDFEQAHLQSGQWFELGVRAAIDAPSAAMESPTGMAKELVDAGRGGGMPDGLAPKAGIGIGSAAKIRFGMD